MWGWDQSLSDRDDHKSFMRSDDICIVSLLSIVNRSSVCETLLADSCLCQAFGTGDEGWGLWLSADFQECLTARSSTFHNQPLFEPTMITPDRIEVWEIMH